MSSLFGGGGAPAPQPVPINPVQDNDAEQKRAEAAAAAQAQAAAAGRASTIAGGGDIAATEQMRHGLLAKRRRDAAASEILG